jgi:hemolysin activation/secretion protein
MDRERETSLPKNSIPKAPALKPTKPSNGQTIVVKAFVLKGNTLLSTEQLTPVVAQYLGQPLTFTELQQAAAAIATAYRSAGWVVSAYLPTQDFLDGNLSIQIVEAVFGGAKLEAAAPARFSEERLMRFIDSAQNKGEALNADKLDRALLIMDDLAGVSVSGSLSKGAGVNETELALKTADEPLIQGEVAIDNSGSRSTGSERLNGNFYLNSPLGWGDQASANLMHAQGTDYGRVAYTFPLGNDGFRLGASGSYLSYALVTDNFQGIQAKGTSSTFGAELNYPLIRSRINNLYAGLSVEHKGFTNESGLAAATHYAIDTMRLSLNGNVSDKFGGGGSNAAGLTLTFGELRPDAPNPADPAALSGSFAKINYQLRRQQAITDSISAYVAVSGQFANTNLDSAEKFSLGGASGVRAYPSSEGGGADGHMVNLELRSLLPNNFNLTGFYDYGLVRVNHHNDTFVDPNTIILKGAGLSLAWQPRVGLNLKATWAQRIGSNPNPTSTGMDQDGTLQENRFWLNASMAF